MDSSTLLIALSFYGSLLVLYSLIGLKNQKITPLSNPPSNAVLFGEQQGIMATLWGIGHFLAGIVTLLYVYNSTSQINVYHYLGILLGAITGYLLYKILHASLPNKNQVRALVLLGFYASIIILLASSNSIDLGILYKFFS